LTGTLLNLFALNAGLEKELGDLKDAAQYVMDLYVPQEEGAEPKPLIDRLDEDKAASRACFWTPPSSRRPWSCRR
jgi:hypothetical protein